MKYARVEAGKVVEIVEAPREDNGVVFQLAELYHPSIVATMHECDETVEVGDDFDEPVESIAAAVDGDTGNGEPPKP